MAILVIEECPLLVADGPMELHLAFLAFGADGLGVDTVAEIGQISLNGVCKGIVRLGGPQIF